ncbi:MAG TPA: hypothetical protein VMW75_21145 [Thermoanaerobaculia bacterium]|nr:hypothetical protein [Thermoanaerobaculia bacterium]
MPIRRRDHFPRALSLAGLPALALMALAVLAAAAPLDPAATDPRGHSHGHPGGGGGQLTFQLHPDVWNTNFPKSQGFVEAFITGDGAASVDLGSIMLSGDSATAAPLAPSATRQEDHHTVARFTMAAAFALLANPKPGETHTLMLTFTVNGKSMQLTTTVRIVGPGGPGSGGGGLQLRIAPDVWNTNFAHAEGTVAFFITGADVKGIDLKSIQLMGDSTSASPLNPASVKQEDHHVVARFAMEDAFALLNAPKAGEMHKVTLSFSLNGTATTLSGEVRIVGPS